MSDFWDSIKKNLSKEYIDEYISRFNKANSETEKVLEDLFNKADNYDYEDVLCRVALLDFLYSTQIRFKKGGIDTVAKHIVGRAQDIESLKKNTCFDFDKFEELAKIDFKKFNDLSEVKYIDVSNICKSGNEHKIYSFMSKFMSFTMPERYPIMDNSIKVKVLGLDAGAHYRTYCKALGDFWSREIETVISRLPLCV